MVHKKVYHFYNYTLFYLLLNINSYISYFSKIMRNNKIYQWIFLKESNIYLYNMFQNDVNSINSIYFIY